MSRNIIVGGGSGFIGTRLVSSLKQKGHNVSIISRDASKGKNFLSWHQIQKEGLPDADAVVNIPGANILQKRWTDTRKKEILESRIGTTKILVNAMNASKGTKPKVFVSGSAVGIYPLNRPDVFDESYFPDKEPDNFAGKVCYQWEHASDSLDPSIRKVIARFGIVIGAGGALKEMILPFKFGLGGPIGSGEQPWPWVYIDDVVGIIEHAINNDSMKGVYNAVAPEIVTNKQFAKTLGSVLNRPAIIPLPEFAVNILFGESAYMLTTGQKVAPTRTLQTGYTFKQPRLEGALRNAVKDL